MQSKKNLRSVAGERYQKTGDLHMLFQFLKGDMFMSEGMN